MFIASSDRAKNWEKDALNQLLDCPFKFKSRLRISYEFYMKDLIQRDLDNLICSTNDLLQLANCEYEINKNGKKKPKKGTGIIVGDHWVMLEIGSAVAYLDREDPRVVITIEEIKALAL